MFDSYSWKIKVNVYYVLKIENDFPHWKLHEIIELSGHKEHCFSTGQLWQEVGKMIDEFLWEKVVILVLYGNPH